MKVSIKITSLLSLLLIFINGNLKAQTLPDKELDSLILALEITMSKRENYDAVKKNRIQKLKDLLASEDNSEDKHYYITDKIIDEYEYYSYDSALYYTEKNISFSIATKNKFNENESKIRLAKLLSETGRYKESIDVLYDIERSSISEELLYQYYYSLNESYTGLSYYTEVQSKKEAYTEVYKKYQDSLTRFLKPNTEETLRLKEKEFRDDRKIEQALQINDIRISNLSSGTRLFSLVAFERSLLYELTEDYNNQKKYLILSAQSDIISSVKDNASMTVLAMLLFKENEVEKAHDFINFAVSDAEFFNSRLRYVNISNILSVISKAYEEKTIAQNKQLRLFLTLLIIFGCILLVFIGFIIKQVKSLGQAKSKLKNTNNELKSLNKKLNQSNSDLQNLYKALSDSDKIKENYIGTFLNLYSEYINKLDNYRKVVHKYVITNKTRSLLELTKSKHVVEEELQLFYKNFDDSFLHIYPDFIEEVNKLLKVEEQISVTKDESLNTELRILALIRLGITDSARISKILRYSVNTIYNYRVKLKNKALGDRDDFENKVKSIN